jgi:hypothetical protein
MNTTTVNNNNDSNLLHQPLLHFALDQRDTNLRNHLLKLWVDHVSAKIAGMVVPTDKEFEKFAWSATNNSFSDTTSCTVCLDELAKGDIVKMLPCGHIFHDRCIDEWLKHQKACPNCRASVTHEEGNLKYEEIYKDIHGNMWQVNYAFNLKNGRQ